MGAAKWRVRELLQLVEAKPVAVKARIGQAELRRLGRSIAEALLIRRNQDNLARDFERASQRVIPVTLAIATINQLGYSGRDKRTPNCRLVVIHALVDAERERATHSALEGAAVIGLDFQSVEVLPVSFKEQQR